MDINSIERIKELGENVIEYIKLRGVQTYNDDIVIDQVKQLVSSMVKDFNNKPITEKISDTVSVIDINALKMIQKPAILPIIYKDEMIVACLMGGYLMAFNYIAIENDMLHRQMISVDDALKCEKALVKLS